MAPRREIWYGLLIPDADAGCFLRDLRVVASVVGGAALAAIPVFLLNRWSGVWLCPVVFLLCLVAVLAVGGLERRMRSRRPEEPASARPTAPETARPEPAAIPGETAAGRPTATPAAADAGVENEVLRGEVKEGIWIAGGILIAAFILASLLFGWEWLGFGALFLFAYLVLFGAPYWLAALQEKGDEQRERFTRRPS